ncbi:unnamed protein product, partial [Anisakis simplex]|uniref:Uncharacterized protein n=1 Tax=Anisakis simplex TaxID=6269 RepID=A0A0M3J8X5_ANISI
MSSRMRRCAQLAFSSSQQASSSSFSSPSIQPSSIPSPTQPPSATKLPRLRCKVPEKRDFMDVNPERTNEDFFRNYDPMVGVGTAAILCAFIFLVTIKSFLKWLTRKFRMFRLMHSASHRRHHNSADIEATATIVQNTDTDAGSTPNDGCGGAGGGGTATDSTSVTTIRSPLKCRGTDNKPPSRRRGSTTTIKPIIRDKSKVPGMSTAASVPVLGGTVTNLSKSVVLETKKVKLPNGTGH